MITTLARTACGAQPVVSAILISLTMLTCVGCSAVKQPAPPNADLDQKQLVILETLLLPQDSWAVNNGNSWINVDTPGVRKVAATGDSALPPLVKIMRNESLSFHTFTCCAAACERIIREHDPNYKLPWGGGLSVVPLASGILIKPDGQMFPLQFRRKVASDIEKKCRELGVN